MHTGTASKVEICFLRIPLAKARAYEMWRGPVGVTAAQCSSKCATAGEISVGLLDSSNELSQSPIVGSYSTKTNLE